MKFESYHPGINFIFFVLVIAATVCCNQPVCLAVAFVAAGISLLVFRGWKGLGLIGLVLVLAIGFGWYYGSYHHFGVTVLTENWIGNQITLESLLYGLVLGIQAGTVILWMACVHEVMTTDKLLFLLGLLFPKGSLVICLLLRMMPVMKEQVKRVAVAKAGIGKGCLQGNLFVRLIRILGIGSGMITWLIGHLHEKAGSMNSRGFGLPKRRNYSLYRFDYRDRGLVIALSSCAVVVFCGGFLDQTRMQFNPELRMNHITPVSVMIYCILGAGMLLPAALQIYSNVRYDRITRKEKKEN